MLFNSYIFLFAFLPATWLLFRLLALRGGLQAALALLVVASLAFYSYWNPPFVLLIVLSIAFNHAWGRRLAARPSRSMLAVGVAMNLGVLGFFKYAGFAMDTLRQLGGPAWAVPEIFLPLGISFFTFQQIAWLVDCHRGLATEASPVRYALFVSFFPQLIAGPIVHHAEMMPQFARRAVLRLDWKNLSLGIALLAIGLFKKVCVADSFSGWVGEAFDGPEAPDFLSAWVGTLAYTFQIYFDFSGYSDMAMGLARLFNVRIPENFDAPYRATNISEFWRRWHMTLSRFLKDYLYIPLGGNRRGTARRYVNLMITMVLGGLWHGAAWTFVIWGGLHGLYLCVHHAWRWQAGQRGWGLPAPVAWAVTFAAVVVGWVLFRATTLGRAVEILAALAGLRGLGAASAPRVLARVGGRVLALVGAGAACLTLPVSWRWAEAPERRDSAWSAVLVGGMLAASVLGLTRVSEFLYFQF